jgi:hypothetical protein
VRRQIPAGFQIPGDTWFVATTATAEVAPAGSQKADAGPHIPFRVFDSLNRACLLSNAIGSPKEYTENRYH